MSRKEERKNNADKKDKKRKADLKAGKNRGEDKDIKVINDLEMRSILMEEVNSLAFQVQTESITSYCSRYGICKIPIWL